MAETIEGVFPRDDHRREWTLFDLLFTIASGVGPDGQVVESLLGQGRATHAFLVTPNDDADLEKPAYISFATAGDLKITTAGGETLTIPSGALATGIVHPIKVKRVFETGTNAEGIVGYYQ